MTAKHRKPKTRFLRRFATVVLAVATIEVVASCDTSITNPGGAQDAFLDSLSAHSALVTGARRSLSNAMGHIIYWSGAMVFEINPSGSTDNYGIQSYIQAGYFRETDSGDWNDTQEARWVAEDAVRRYRRTLPEILGAPDFNSYAPAAQALVWAGYSNRLLGENFCEVTFDGSGLLPHTAAFERADSLFQEAIPIATATGEDDYLLAAYAGRAQVLAHLATYGLASWAAAAAEAARVPDTFVWLMPFFDQEIAQYNYLYWANADLPYRAHTVWGTYWENEPDPRTPFTITAKTGDAGVQKFGGLTPWYPEGKDTSKTAPVELASGWEMRLIRAEAALANNDLTEAANQMNVRRADLGLALYPVPFASLTDGYTALKYERAAELWLEARRMGDVRRWIENNIPGDYLDGNYRDGNQDNQYPNKVEDLSTRDRAYWVGRSEVETNANVSPDQLKSCSPGG